MPNLENCTVTQYGPVLETPGDSIPSGGTNPNLPGQLELQTVEELEEMFGVGFLDEFWGSDSASGVTEGEHVGHGWYFLKISANPGYHITKEQISINGTASDLNYWWGGDTTVNGDSVLPDEVSDLWLYDTFVDENNIFQGFLGSDDNWRCNNFVIVVVILKSNFVMPEEQVVIKIDFDGDALICNETPPGGETESGLDKQLTWEMKTGIIITNHDHDTSQAVFMASYYEDDYLYNPFNHDFISYGDHGLSSIAPQYLSEGGVNGPTILADNPNLPCLGESQPSCFENFGSYAYIINRFSIYPPMTAEQAALFGLTLNDISTDAGKIMVPYMYPFGWTILEGHPNYSGQIYNSTGAFGFNAPNIRNYRYRIYQNAPSSYTYPTYVTTPQLSLEDYPVIYPGGGQVPSAETWDIEIGNNYNSTGWGGDDWQLIAEPEFVDVWSAITIVDILDGQQVTEDFTLDPLGLYSVQEDYSPLNQLNADNCTYALYTEGAGNECDMDLSKVTLTQITPKRVRITVPYRTNLGWTRSLNQDLSNRADKRRNKIFINIYPTQI